MNTLPPAARTSTILYCDKWTETVAFYEKKLGLPVSFRSSWFVEFALSNTARLSVADALRTTVKSAAGQGITLSLQMQNIESVWRFLHDAGINPTTIKEHSMQARVFYFHDPEGYRIEVWSALSSAD